MPPLFPETYVWIDASRNMQEGQINRECDQPRLYDVVTAQGNFRRDCRVLFQCLQILLNKIFLNLPDALCLISETASMLSRLMCSGEVFLIC